MEQVEIAFWVGMFALILGQINSHRISKLRDKINKKEIDNEKTV